MKTHYFTTALALGLLAAPPAFAQMSMPGMGAMPGKPAPGPASNNSLAGMSGMGQMSMTSSVDLNSPMSQEASGTAWLPSATPLYGKMIMKPNGDMLMLHGDVHARYVNVGSKRGDRRFDAPNWFMGMYSHPLDARSQLGLRAMVSLDPLTEGGYGYPLLFQTGESWHHDPLHDRQHPHDLFSELSATYSRLLGGGSSAYFYAGDPGEPALGPPTYMHRLIAYDLPGAPIGHHWEDATHITFGVATAGLNLGNKVKLEASDFTGREPDENRYSFDKPRFDSYSGRVSYNPDARNAFQVSYGFIKNAEGDGVNQHRITGSWIYDRPLGADANFTSTLVWGQNNLADEGRSNAYLAEADYQNKADTVFARVENIQKSGHELVLPEEYHDRKFTLGAYTAGYVRDLTHGRGVDTGVGFAVTANTKPSALDPIYGTGTPVSFEVFFRFRPSRMNMGGSRMAAMDPGENDSPPAAPSALRIAATMAAPPQPRQKNTLTVTVTDAAGTPVSGATVRADVAMTSMDMGTTHPAFQDLGGGRYQGEVEFSMRGPWRITLTVTPPGGATQTKTLDYSVGG